LDKTPFGQLVCPSLDIYYNAFNTQQELTFDLTWWVQVGNGRGFDFLNGPSGKDMVSAATF
jgi:hypothetical protein